jgi:hypothetical protein
MGRAAAAELTQAAVVNIAVGGPEGVGGVPLACRELTGGVAAGVVPVVAAVGGEQLRPCLDALGGREPGRFGRGKSHEPHIRRRHGLAIDIARRVDICANTPPQSAVDGNILRHAHTVDGCRVARIAQIQLGPVEDLTAVGHDVFPTLPGPQREETPARPGDRRGADVEAEQLADMEEAKGWVGAGGPRAANAAGADPFAGH